MQRIVVIPTYNERENLEHIVRKIWEYADDLHIFVVDDNSPDGTGKIADELSRKYVEKLFVLHRERKEGLGRAYAEAFTHVLKEK